MILIDYAEARQILNSRGEPTVEVTLLLNNGRHVKASVPSGKSRASREAFELFDKEFNIYFGRSVNRAVENINKVISPRLKKLDPNDQFRIDELLMELDGTPNKQHMGSNAMLAVSYAVAKAAAVSKNKELYEQINELYVKIEAKNKFGEPIVLTDKFLKPKLPIPAFTMINGGLVSDSTLPVEEYMIFAVSIPTMAEKIRAAAEINFELHRILHEKGKHTNIGDEGGYSTTFVDVYEPLDILAEAVHHTNYYIKNQVLYGIDVAKTHASSPIPDDFLDNVMTKYPVLAVIDPFDEEDIESHATLNKAYENIFVTGDDLTAMVLDRLYLAIDKDAIDCAVIKPNQIGTLTETLRFAKVAKDAGVELFVSDRSGETNDTFTADLAVGIGAEFFKSGNVMRGERVAKYNRLMELAKRFEI